MAEAKEEIKEGQHFDHQIVNDKFEEALTDLKSIVLINEDLTEERKDLVKLCIESLLEE